MSHQHLRESQALHLDYYKRKEKKIFDINETSLWHPRARAQGDAFSVAPTSFASVRESGGISKENP